MPSRDHDFAALVDEDDEFEQVARSIRADDEPAVWVLLNGVLDVEIVDVVPAGGGMNLHTGISYYKIQAAGMDERDFVARDLGAVQRGLSADRHFRSVTARWDPTR